MATTSTSKWQPKIVATFLVVLVLVTTNVSRQLEVNSISTLYMNMNAQLSTYNITNGNHTDESFGNLITSFFIPETPDKNISQRVQASLPPQNNSTTSGSRQEHPLTNCSVTSQVRLDICNNTLGVQMWFLQTLDEWGQPKTIGGDEFYITFEDYKDPYFGKETNDPTGVAILTNLPSSGKYSLDFFQPPLRIGEHAKPFVPQGLGRLTVHFQYSCHIGRWDRSDKKSWKNNGSSRAKYILENVPSPPLKPFASHSVDLDPDAPDLSKYHNVICFGDSIMENFCGMWWHAFQYHKANIHCAGNLEMDYSTDMVEDILGKLRRKHAEMLLSANQTTAIILGSAAWDVLTDRSKLQNKEFDDHLEAVRQVTERIQTTYPNVTIYWKSPQAFHVHALYSRCYREVGCAKRTKHLSASNSRFLHDRQTELMDQLMIPVIDIYDATYLSAAWMMAGDGRHYRKDLNWELMNFSYPKSYPETKVPKKKLRKQGKR